jgi:FkbM family methyltransferase
MGEAELEKLLAEGVAGATMRQQATFDRIAAPCGDALVLFGAGKLGRKMLTGLRRQHTEPLAFTDNNSAIWNTMVDGVPVLAPPEAAQKYGKSAAFVITIWGASPTERMTTREQQLRELGCVKVINFIPLFWKFPAESLPHCMIDEPRKVQEQADLVRRACALWADDASRCEYLAQLRWRLYADFDGLSDPAPHAEYFPSDLVAVQPDEVFVDCGAYNGDTIESFLRQSGSCFREIVAFEPDPANYLKLQANVSRLPTGVRGRIVTHRAALGPRNGRVPFLATGTEGSAVGSGELEVDSVALDETLENKHPTYIKMDVEGAELDALAGARRLIEMHMPVLAICCYHLQDHLWRIPILIHDMNPNYWLFLRPHVVDGWDLVCYAIPKQRLTPAGERKRS